MKIIDNQSILLDIYQEYRLPPGLFYGNTGLGIVLLLSRQLSCDDFFGKSILDMKSISTDITLESGITGVGIALNYLFQKLQKKQLRGLLSEIDSKVCQKVACDSNVDIDSSYGAVFYLCHRLRNDKHLSGTIREIFEFHIAASTEHIIDYYIGTTHHDYRFSLRHSTSVFVFALSMVLSCTGNKTMWIKKIKPMLPVLLEVYPFSPGNRLMYWHALSQLNKLLEGNKKISNHIAILQHSISQQSLLDCVNGNVYLGEGACGIYYLSRHFPEFKDSMSNFSHEIENYISNSLEIHHLGDIKYLKNHLGMWDGVAGIMLIESLMRTDCIFHGNFE